jgi:tetratricopeptide (TPR) repeat protein
VIESADADEAARADALAVRGEARRRAGDPTAALADFAAALALQPEHRDAKLGRAGVLVASGQLDAASAVIDAIIEAGDAPARAYALRGDVRMRYGDRAGAIAAYDEALARDPRQAEVLAARGLAKQADGNLDGARVDLDAALALQPENAPARAGRCWNRMRRQGDIADARRDAEAAIAADPSLTDAHLCLGLVLLRQEQWQMARTAYDAALRLEPANAAALFGRGFARREAGERREGAADIRRAYEFNSDIDEEFERLGVDF